MARGIIAARGTLDVGCPIVVRFDGTNAEEAKDIMRPHLKTDFVMVPTMMEAARQAVQLAGAST